MGGGGIPTLQGSDGDCPQLCCRPKGKWGDRLGEKTRGRRKRRGRRRRKRRMRRRGRGRRKRRVRRGRKSKMKQSSHVSHDT